MRSRSAVLASAAVLALSGALAACSTSTAPGGPAAATSAAQVPTPPPAGSPAALPGTDWPTYHRDAARTGAAPATPVAGPLAIAWRRHLDGAVYGQPLVVGGLVIAATEGDTVYGLDRATGQVRWQVHLGTPVPLAALPCGDIDPLGITGTPVYDPATGLVYAVAETTGYHHMLAAIAVRGGKLAFRRDVPTPDGRPRYDQQRAALALDQGRVYVAFGGLDGDCGPYRGSINGIPASGRGPIVFYRVPTAREGGMWAAGGPAAGPDGTIYVSAGNGAASAPPYDGSDSVTALTPALRRTGIFAPAAWAADNASDADLGSTAPGLLGDGMILADGKSGTGYLLNAHHLTGVGSQVAKAPVCTAPSAGWRPRAPSSTCRASPAGWPPWTPPATGSRCSGAAQRGRRARRCSVAARSGCPTGTPGCSTSSTRAPGRSGTRSASARRSPTSPPRPCPAASRWWAR